MTNKKTQVKKYMGYTFVFVPRLFGDYKVSVSGFSAYWIQHKASVLEAYRRFKNS